MKHVSRWEKAARKMVTIDNVQSPEWIGDWRVTYPSCAAPGTYMHAYFATRNCARRAANSRIKALALILQRASKLAGF
jgi:hypothetical protein